MSNAIGSSEAFEMRLAPVAEIEGKPQDEQGADEKGRVPRQQQILRVAKEP